MEDGERKTTNGISEDFFKEKIQELVREELSRQLSETAMKEMSGSLQASKPELEETNKSKLDSPRCDMLFDSLKGTKQDISINNEEGICLTVHTGFTCDNCKITPIKGIRYHSLMKKNFDLCSDCEKKVDHEHPMIRFREKTHRNISHNSWETMHHLIKRVINIQKKVSSSTSEPYRAEIPHSKIVKTIFDNVLPLLGFKRKQRNPRKMRVPTQQYSEAVESNKKLEESLRSREDRCELNEADKLALAKTVENLSSFLPHVSLDNLTRFAHKNRQVTDPNQLTNLALKTFPVD